MALTNVTTPNFTVGSVSSQLSNNLTPTQLQNRLSNLDLTSSTAVYQEVSRCNDRCSGNDVDVSVTALSRNPDDQNPITTIQVSFHDSDSTGA
jgi:hypothetical protein